MRIKNMMTWPVRMIEARHRPTPPPGPTTVEPPPKGGLGLSDPAATLRETGLQGQRAQAALSAHQPATEERATRPIEVRIYLSIAPEFMFRRYRSGIPLRLVDDYTLQVLNEQPAEATLEAVWREQVIVHGSERPARLRHRSLTVGDVVQLEDRAWAVDLTGWREVPVVELNVLRASDDPAPSPLPGDARVA